MLYTNCLLSWETIADEKKINKYWSDESNSLEISDL